jgi:hypothetical protein
LTPAPFASYVTELLYHSDTDSAAILRRAAELGHHASADPEEQGWLPAQRLSEELFDAAAAQGDSDSLGEAGLMSVYMAFVLDKSKNAKAQAHAKKMAAARIEAAGDGGRLSKAAFVDGWLGRTARKQHDGYFDITYGRKVVQAILDLQRAKQAPAPAPKTAPAPKAGGGGGGCCSSRPPQKAAATKVAPKKAPKASGKKAKAPHVEHANAQHMERVCRGTWASVTIDRLRHFTQHLFKRTIGHRLICSVSNDRWLRSTRRTPRRWTSTRWSTRRTRRPLPSTRPTTRWRRRSGRWRWRRARWQTLTQPVRLDGPERSGRRPRRRKLRWSMRKRSVPS